MSADEAVVTVESDRIQDFDPDDLRQIAALAEKVEALAKWAGRRLVVEAWSPNDRRPVVWVECHPCDSCATITFTRAPGPGIGADS